MKQCVHCNNKLPPFKRKYCNEECEKQYSKEVSRKKRINHFILNLNNIT